jgi:SAM-dependent methyltransferase
LPDVMPIPIELATLGGDTSMESYYWNSGWFTANVQMTGELRPGDSIIDIGCGCGRLAYGLHGWFGGRYVGVDIVPSLIEFCQKRFPRFEFHHLNVKSEYYNPQGSADPEAGRIPMPDRSFDLAVLFSVYTHLLPDTFRRVTADVARLLKPGGRCLATFFLLDEKSDRAAFSFAHERPECRIEKPESPEHAVAYTRRFVEDSFRAAGFRVKNAHRGSWTGQPGLSFQDQLLFVKE